ncbi:MAG TPA: uracil-DNA glycosylase family protein [Candidatus Dormibacteraeota bacterium]
MEDGVLESAAPTFEGSASSAFFLIGQAPGPVEAQVRRPFMGRAGRELARWVLRAGFASEAEFRRVTYMVSLIRCFPGRNASDTGDRPPPRRAIENCAPWLEAELALLRPRLVILVGGLAIGRFLGEGPLEEWVGRVFDGSSISPGAVALPLPHPSGQNRWLNSPVNRGRLEAGLALLSEFRERWITPAS